jgi:prepilin-type N-terminal cleavage/methylation domain-containing protein
MARRPPARRDDAGFTLIEVMVSMTLMTIVMAIVTGGIVTMYRTSARAEAGAQVQSALNAAFAKLDRDIRYAQRINAPTAPGTSYAVTFVTLNAAGTPQCVQLSLPQTGGTLVRRQWPQASTSADPATVRATVALQLAPMTAGANPFTVTSGGAGGSDFDRLRVQVNSTAGLTARGRTRSYDEQFTALNTVPASKPLPCTP